MIDVQIPVPDRSAWLQMAYRVMHENTQTPAGSIALALYVFARRRDVLLRDVAVHVGVDRHTVRKWARRAGLGSRRDPCPIRAAEIRASYERTGSLTDTGLEVGMSHDAVRRYVVAAGGRVRTAGEVIADRLNERNPRPPGMVSCPEAARMLGWRLDRVQRTVKRGAIPGARQEPRPADRCVPPRMRWLIPIEWVRATREDRALLPGEIPLPEMAAA